MKQNILILRKICCVKFSYDDRKKIEAIKYIAITKKNSKIIQVIKKSRKYFFYI